MGDEFSIEDILIILRRRGLFFAIPFIFIALIGAMIVMVLPAQYASTGTILVESQQIPEELVRSTITGYAQERIETIKQRVMTRNRLLTVADDFSLFDKDTSLSASERARKMRDKLRVRLITAERKRGSSSDGTIAFTVSFQHSDASKAHKVANRFMTLFLDEDVRSRTVGASNTTEFFERETQRLRGSVAEIEQRIADYKSENSDALPEQYDMQLNMLERVRRDVNSIRSNLAQLEEERRFLENQIMSGASNDTQISIQIAQLEADLARLRATYQDGYPEIIAKRNELASLKRSIAPSGNFKALQTDLENADRELIALERSGDATPELIAKAELKIENAREALSEKIAQEVSKTGADSATFQLEGRLTVINNRIRMLKRQETAQIAEIAKLEERINKTPAVERGLAGLSRDYDNVFREYQDMLSKQQAAQLAENLEENQQAEKFSILEPALFPDEPTSPDRPKLLVLSVAFALAAGFGIAMIAEIMMQTLRGRTHISNIIGGAPIAVIPYIDTDEDTSFGAGLFTSKKLKNAPA